ncbi:universal stress protein [Rothia nasimurium]|uniref:universal stress protein n=1 Tax=Rothia nasimurium TaxID=85336 RepID=UPI001F21BC86|nr:universal stress protein [Rothia nasimurium]
MTERELTFGEKAVAARDNLADVANAAGEIIVGIDGSEQSYGALQWAVHEAAVRKVPVRMVTAYSLPVFTGTGFDAGYSMVDEEALTDGVAQILDEAYSRVGDSGVELRATVETGDATAVLLELSKKAELMVVGSRSHGGFLGRLLGTVSTSLPAHSHCPTVAVPHSFAEKIEADPAILDRSLPIVVGSDGSDEARLAMMQAADEANRRGVKLTLVNALAPYTGTLNWVPAAVDFEALYREIADLQRKAAEWIRGYFPQLEIEFKLIDGSPVQVLLEAGKTADLVVVGTRGRGGIAGMILGSTSQGILHNTQVPVMIVPQIDDPRIEQAPDASVSWG